MLLATEMHARKDYKNSWFKRSYIGWKTSLLEEEEMWYIRRLYDFQRKLQSLWKTHFFFARAHKKSWFYENLIQKKKIPQSAKKFILSRPKTAFLLHWKQKKREPWKEILLFRRALYSGFGESLRKKINLKH